MLRSFDDGLMGVALLAGPANVIMQLARPGVGYGVLESRVESGRVDRHPIKRARTTFTYLAVATKGSRRAEGGVSACGESGARAGLFDRREPGRIQRVRQATCSCGWRRACTRARVDVYRLFVGEMDEETAERHYREGLRARHHAAGAPGHVAGGSRRVRPVLAGVLGKVHIDDAVREYLWPIAAGRMRGVKLPIRVQRAFDNFGLLITTGFLPQRFRDEMKLDWNPGMQRRFDRTIGVLRFVNHLMPRFIRQFPFNVLLKDLDWRIRTGRPLV